MGIIESICRIRTAISVLVVTASFAACIVNTRGAVRNDTDETLTVVLKGGGEEATFADVAPQTTTDYRKLPFSKLEGIVLEVVKGAGLGGTVDLVKAGDNVVRVGKDVPPAVEHTENPSNTFW